MNISIKFELRDIWIGLYWKTEIMTWSERKPVRRVTTWYICIVPCVPIIISWERQISQFASTPNTTVSDRRVADSSKTNSYAPVA